MNIFIDKLGHGNLGNLFIIYGPSKDQLVNHCVRYDCEINQEKRIFEKILEEV